MVLASLACQNFLFALPDAPKRTCHDIAILVDSATLTVIKITHSSHENVAGIHGGAQIFNQGF
jgi:hypothetical protein